MKTRSSLMLGALAVALIGTASLAQAAPVGTVYNYTVFPNQNSDGSAGTGISGSFAPGFGGGSIAGNGSTFSKYQFTPGQISPGLSFTLNDIVSVSYFTDKPDNHVIAPPDWYFQIYTTAAVNAHGFYNGRINAEPYFSANLTETAGAWNEWQSDPTLANALRFYDSNINFGTYTDKFLNDATGVKASFGTDNVLAFGVGIGSANAAGFLGQVDGLTLGLANGDTINVNFEPTPSTPLPAAAWGGLAMIGGLGLFQFRKKVVKA